MWLTFELKLDDNDEEGDFCMKGGARSGISGKGEGGGGELCELEGQCDWRIKRNGER